MTFPARIPPSPAPDLTVRLSPVSWPQVKGVGVFYNDTAAVFQGVHKP